MLYDPKWDKQAWVLENATLADLIAWLETKPPAETYDYVTGECLLCRYLQDHHGASQPRVTGDAWSMTNSFPFTPLPPRFDDIAAARAGYCGPTPRDLPVWSYGGALARARAIAAAS